MRGRRGRRPPRRECCITTTGARAPRYNARVPNLPAAQQPVPAWLWRLASGGLLALALAVGALALGLAQGWADPPRAGPLLWQNDFKAGPGGWTFAPAPGGQLAAREGALVAEFAGDAAGQWAVGLAPDAPTGDFTLEVAGAAAGQGNASAYGLVFGWRDAHHYSALLINANGYAQAYRQDGPARTTWFAWQQWPHILVGPENNRLRVDVRGPSATLRVNDEIVATVTSAATAGQVGVAALTTARPASGGPVIFSWARLWQAPD